MSDEARAKSGREEPARPVVERLEENSVANAYRRVVERKTHVEVVCAWCGEELGGSRTVAGPNQYHEACYLAELRAGKKINA
jgi:hypothetical protein